VFRVAVVSDVEPIAVLEALGGAGYRRVGAAPRGGEAFDRVDLSPPLALVLGGEAGGLPDTVAGAVDTLVTIPMAGRLDSLNVAMAGTLLAFEAVRRRSPEPG
jgi:tRNA G18 (ribose-2'-O)-methylase SpoU